MVTIFSSSSFNQPGVSTFAANLGDQSNRIATREHFNKLVSLHEANAG
jgi:hypothetical protein